MLPGGFTGSPCKWQRDRSTKVCMDFSVRVVYHYDGEELPRTNETVLVFNNKSVLSTGSMEETTDEDGVAYFQDCDWQFGAWDVPVKIYVGSSEGAEYDINEGYQITICFDYD